MMESEKELLTREWNALVLKNETSLIRCDKCPIQIVCKYQKKGLSKKLAWKKEKQFHGYVSQYQLDEFKDELEAMEKVWGKCPLRQTMGCWL